MTEYQDPGLSYYRSLCLDCHNASPLRCGFILAEGEEESCKALDDVGAKYSIKRAKTYNQPVFNISECPKFSEGGS